MQVLIPQSLGILESSVPEDDAPAWDAETMYTEGMRVIDDHYVFQCRTENTGVRPSENADIDGASWRTVSITNQWACLDIYGYTQTQAAEGETKLTITVPFTRPASGIALLNMRATAVTVAVHDSDGELVWSDEGKDLLKDVRDWWEYWFEPFRFERDYIASGIPPVSGTATITLEYGNRPAVGTIVVGEHVVFGGTRYGVQSGFTDHSQITTDTFGNSVWTQRRKARKGTYPVWFAPSDLDYIHGRIEDLLGAPALWIGSDGVRGLNSLVIFGFLKEYEASVDAFSYVSANFEIQGII